jgi:hypothetical protein
MGPMPYVNCTRCGLVNFTVAYWSNLDGCSGCGEPLPRPGAGFRTTSLRPAGGRRPKRRVGSAARARA